MELSEEERSILVESYLFKKHNLKTCYVCVTRLSQTDLDKYKVKELDVSESCDQQTKNNNDTVSFKSKPGITNIESHECDSEKSDVETESETKGDTSLLCPNQHDEALRSSQEEEELQNEFTSELIIKSEPECDDYSALRSSQEKEELQNEFTSELIIKSEPEWSDVEDTQDNAENEDVNHIQGNIIIIIIKSLY
jgi:hypothetical protein